MTGRPGYRTMEMIGGSSILRRGIGVRVKGVTGSDAIVAQ